MSTSGECRVQLRSHRDRSTGPMLRPRIARFGVFSALVLALFFASPARGLDVDPELAGRLAKAPEAELDLLVLLDSAPDWERFERQLGDASPQERRRRALETLRNHAEETQAGIAALPAIRAKAVGVDAVRNLWLANAMVLRGGRDVLEALAASDVEGWVTEDRAYGIVEAVRSADPPAAPPGAAEEAPLAKTPGVVWSLDWIRAPDVWAQGYDGTGVLVAHLDSGVWLEHPDLAQRLWVNPGEIPGNEIDDDGNGYVDDVHGYDFGDRDSDPTDDGFEFAGGGHGTHTAGTVCGDGTGGLRTGVAPGAKIMVCKPAISEIGESSFGAIVEGQQYALTMGAHLMTMSLGAVGEAPPFYMQAERRVGDALRAAGVALFNSSGNVHQFFDPPFELTTASRVPSPWHPVFDTPYSSRSGIISVGATAYQDDSIWDSSSQGPADWGAVRPYSDWDFAQGNGLIKPDISAPGNGISSLIRPAGYSQTNWSGTSMACPHAAGVAALMLHKNPSLSPEDLDRILQQTAVDLGDPGKDNVFGSGRIDALAAVNAVPTVQRPSLYIAGYEILDEGGNGTIAPGESFDLMLEIGNNSRVLDAEPVSALIFVVDPLVTVVDGQTTIAIVPQGETAVHASDALSFVLSADAVEGDSFEIQVFLSAQNGYTVLIDLPIPIGLPEYRTHDAGGVQLTVTDRGTLGWWNLEQLEGVGFRGGFSNLLYIGGLWGGNSKQYVCNRDYIPTDPEEWNVTTTPNGRLDLAQIPLADEHYVARFDDSLHASPKGIQVVQHSMAWGDGDAQDFVILRYEVTNAGTETIADYHVGLFCDWDFDFPWYTRAGTDLPRRMAYMQDVYITGEHAGIKLLDPPAAANVTVIHNPTYVHPNLQILGLDKWSMLNGDLQQLSGTEDDEYSTLVSAGPFTLEPGGHAIVSFALVYGTDLADLRANADLAQQRFDSSPTPVSDGPAPARFALEQNAPNPFNPVTNIQFHLKQSGPVRLTVTDVMGRVVRRLADGHYAAGRHAVQWDGHDDAGAAVASGVYVYRIETEEGARARKMALVK